jgi:hypothetical protein
MLRRKKSNVLVGPTTAPAVKKPSDDSSIIDEIAEAFAELDESTATREPRSQSDVAPAPDSDADLEERSSRYGSA